MTKLLYTKSTNHFSNAFFQYKPTPSMYFTVLIPTRVLFNVTTPPQILTCSIVNLFFLERMLRALSQKEEPPWSQFMFLSKAPCGLETRLVQVSFNFVLNSRRTMLQSFLEACRRLLRIGEGEKKIMSWILPIARINHL